MSVKWNWDPVPRKYRTRSRPARQSVECIQLLATRTTTTTEDNDRNGDNPFASLKAIADIYRRKRQSTVDWSFNKMPELSISSDESTEDSQSHQELALPLIEPMTSKPMTSTPQSVSRMNPRLRALKGLDPNTIRKTPIDNTLRDSSKRQKMSSRKSFVPEYMERTILDSSPYGSPFTPKTVVKKKRRSRPDRTFTNTIMENTMHRSVISTTTQTNDSLSQRVTTPTQKGMASPVASVHSESLNSNQLISDDLMPSEPPIPEELAQTDDNDCSHSLNTASEHHSLNSPILQETPISEEEAQTDDNNCSHSLTKVIEQHSAHNSPIPSEPPESEEEAETDDNDCGQSTTSVSEHHSIHNSLMPPEPPESEEEAQTDDDCGDSSIPVSEHNSICSSSMPSEKPEITDKAETEDNDCSGSLTNISEQHSIHNSFVPPETSISEAEAQNNNSSISSIGSTKTIGKNRLSRSARSQLNLNVTSNPSPITSPTFSSNKSTKSVKEDISPNMPMSPVGSVESESLASSRRSSGLEKHLNNKTLSSSENMPIMSNQEINSNTNEEHLSIAPVSQSLSESLSKGEAIASNTEDKTSDDQNMVEEEGLRRSKRRRMHILEYWRGQRPIYKRDSSGVTEKVVEIVEGVDYSNNKKRKPVTKKRKVEAKAKKVDIFDLSIHTKFESNANENEVKDLLRIKSLEDLQWKKSKLSTGVDIAIINKNKAKGDANGMMRLKARAKKNKSKTGDYATHLTVTYGALDLKIEDNPSVVVRTGYSFTVDANTFYELNNLRNDTAFVAFTVLKA